uniref:CNNM transmembrane domain-containing protein n=1 Tax=Ascaris lumbricoides TaxID=6252 RepID=A0A0M3HUN4_ASCLU
MKGHGGFCSENWRAICFLLMLPFICFLCAVISLEIEETVNGCEDDTPYAHRLPFIISSLLASSAMELMMIPVAQHKLIKISHSNQRLLTKLSCCSSLLAFLSNLTNSPSSDSNGVDGDGTHLAFFDAIIPTLQGTVDFRAGILIASL